MQRTLMEFFHHIASKKVKFMNLINIYICVVVLKNGEVEGSRWVKESDMNTDTVTQWIVMGTTVYGEGNEEMCAYIGKD